MSRSVRNGIIFGVLLVAVLIGFYAFLENMPQLVTTAPSLVLLVATVISFVSGRRKRQRPTSEEITPLQPEWPDLNPWLVSYLVQHHPTKSRYEIDKYLIEAGYSPKEIEIAWQRLAPQK
jgi:hypothetical protein